MKSECHSGIKRVTLNYSEALKHEVGTAIKGGMSYQQACLKYGIKSPSTVHGWIKSHGGFTKGRKMKSKRNQSKEPEAQSKLDKEKRDLELALSRMSLKVYCLETVIEEASKYYQEDLKKKFTQP